MRTSIHHALFVVLTVPLASLGCAFEALEGGDAAGTSAVDHAPEAEPVGTTSSELTSCGTFTPKPLSFDFNGGTAQGFQSAGVFDYNGTVPVEDVSRNPALWVNGLGSHGALAMSGYDFNGVPVTSEYRRADFISPTAKAYAHGNGNYSFRIYQDIAFPPFPPGVSFQAQVVLKVRRCDGSIAHYQAVDPAGKPVFCSAPFGQWTTCNASIPVPLVQGSVTNVIIRAFVPKYSIGEGMVLLDDIRAE